MLTFKQYLTEQAQEAPAHVVQSALDNILNNIQQSEGNIDQLMVIKNELEEISKYVPRGAGEKRPTHREDPRAKGEEIGRKILNAYRKVNKLIAHENPTVVDQINEAKTFPDITGIIDQYLQVNG